MSLSALKQNALNQPGVIAAFILPLVLFLLAPSKHYYPDGVFRLAAIENGNWEQLFKPSHMLHDVLSVVLLHALGLLGYQGAILVPVQIMSAVLGAGTIALLFASVRKLTANLLVSTVVSALLAFSFGVWWLSVEAMYATTSYFFAACSLFLMVYSETTPSWRLQSLFPYLLGFVTGLAVLAFQANAIMAFGGAVYLLLARDAKSPRWSMLVRYGVALTLVVGIPYALTGVTIAQVSSVGGFWAWIMSARTDPLRSIVNFQPTLDVLYRSPTLFIDSIVTFGSRAGPYAHWGGRWTLLETGPLTLKLPYLMSYGGVLVWLLGGLYCIAMSRRHLFRRWRALSVPCMVMLISYAAFALYFSPYGEFNWTLPFLVMLLMISLAANHLAQTHGRLVNSGIGVASGFLVVVLAISNFSLGIRPLLDLSSNEMLKKAEFFRENTQDEDVIMTLHWDWAEFYVPYFAHREAIPILRLYAQFGYDKPMLMNFLQEKIEMVRAEGARVFAIKIFDMTGAQAELSYLGNMDLSASDFEAFERRVAWQLEDEVIWEITNP